MGIFTKADIPVIFFISKMDEENANYNQAFEQLQSNFGTGTIPFQLQSMKAKNMSVLPM